MIEPDGHPLTFIGHSSAHWAKGMSFDLGIVTLTLAEKVDKGQPVGISATDGQVYGYR